jgi:protein O-GlcNAc transferase
MGVPVLTLTGDRHCSRVTTSQLRSLNLDVLIAPDRNQYIDIAVQLASDTEALNKLRQGLRERFLSSALVDYQGFTTQLETRFRDIWRQWCEKGGD